MSISQDEKGFLILDIPATGNNSNKNLQDANCYFSTL